MIGVHHVTQAIFATAGRPVLLRALAVGMAVGIAASILFSPVGLSASDVVRVLHSSAPARALLWTGWLLLAAPTMSVAFDAPGTTILRSLRLRRTHVITALLALTSLAHVPWAILFGRGGGAVEAVGALLLAVSIGAAALAMIRRPRLSTIAITALGAALVLLDPPAIVLAIAASMLAPLSVHLAWSVALERRPLAWRLTRPTHPVLALYAMYLLLLQRAARARIVIACLSAATGLAGLLLSLRNNPTDRPVDRGITVMTLPLVVAAAVCVSPLIECEARVLPLLRSVRARQWAVVAAFLLAVATPTSALAASAGIAMAITAASSLSAAVVALFGWGAALSLGVGLWGRRQRCMAQSGPGTFVVGVALLALVAILLVMSW